MSLTMTVPRGSAVAFPELIAMRAVIGREEERAIHVREVGRDGAGWPGLMSLTMTVPAEVPSLFQSSKPCEPSLAVKRSVPPTFDQGRGVRARAARVDVTDHDGAGRGSVALPELGAVSSIIGGEEER